jgi:hypothetical protein
MRLHDLVAPVHAGGSSLSVAPIRAAIGTGSLAGAVQIHQWLTRPSYDLHMEVRRAPVEELVSGVLPIGSAVTGLLSGVVDLNGPGLPGVAAVADSLRGAMSGTVEQGKIRESPALDRLRASLGISPTTDLSFRTLTHSLRIVGGRLLLDQVHCDLGKDLADLSGSIGLDHTLDVTLLLHLAPGRFEGGGTMRELARYARDEQGRVPVEVRIGGTDRAPTIVVRPGKALEIAGKNLGEGLRSGLTRALAGDSAATDSSQEDLLKRGRGALQRLLGK